MINHTLQAEALPDVKNLPSFYCHAFISVEHLETPFTFETPCFLTHKEMTKTQKNSSPYHILGG